MCVLIIKPRGVEMPSKHILQLCYVANPHGCGFASESDYYRSLSFKSFYKRLQGVSKDENCIIHFRLATHGSVRKANCHPFYKDGVFFAHNGIMPIKPYRDKTDSETAFLRYFLPDLQKYGVGSQELKYDVYSLLGSGKVAFLKDGEVTTFGNLTTIDGVKYSNLRWQYYYDCKRFDC